MNHEVTIIKRGQPFLTWMPQALQGVWRNSSDRATCKFRAHKEAKWSIGKTYHGRSCCSFGSNRFGRLSNRFRLARCPEIVYNKNNHFLIDTTEVSLNHQVDHHFICLRPFSETFSALKIFRHAAGLHLMSTPPMTEETTRFRCATLLSYIG